MDDQNQVSVEVQAKFDSYNQALAAGIVSMDQFVSKLTDSLTQLTVAFQTSQDSFASIQQNTSSQVSSSALSVSNQIEAANQRMAGAYAVVNNAVRDSADVIVNASEAGIAAQKRADNALASRVVTEAQVANAIVRNASAEQLSADAANRSAIMYQNAANAKSRSYLLIETARNRSDAAEISSAVRLQAIADAKARRVQRDIDQAAELAYRTALSDAKVADSARTSAATVEAIKAKSAANIEAIQASSSAKLLAQSAMYEQRLQQQMAETSSATHSLGGHFSLNGGVIREFGVLLGEIVRGDVHRLESSMIVLSNRMNITGDIVNALKNPFTALTTVVQMTGNAILATTAYLMSNPFLAAAIALAALAVEAYHASNETIKFKNTMDLTGNAAGYSASKFEEAGRTISTSMRVAEGTARDTMLSIARQGGLSANSIEKLTEVTILYGRKTGESTDEAVKHFDKLSRNALESAKQIINEGLIPLTAEELRHIEILDAQGHKAEATAYLIDILDKHLKGMADTTTEAGRAWGGFVSGITEATNAVGRFLTGSATVEDRIKALQIAMRFKSAMGLGTDEEARKAAQKELNDLMEEGHKDEIKAQKEKAANEERLLELQDVGTRKQRKSDRELYDAAIKGEIELEAREAARGRAYDDREKENARRRIARQYLPEQKAPSTKGQSTLMQEETLALENYLIKLESVAHAHKKIFSTEDADLASEKFWASQLKNVAKNQAEQNAIERKFAEARRRVQQDEDRLTVTDISGKAQVAAREKDYQSQIFWLTQLQDKYTKNSVEWKQLTAQIADANIMQTKAVETSALKQVQSDTANAMEKQSAVEARLNQQRGEGVISEKQYYQAMRQSELARRALTEEEIKAEIAIATTAKDTDKIKDIQKLRETELGASYKRMGKLDQEYANQAKKPMVGLFNELEKISQNHFERLLKHQEKFGQAVRFSIGDLLMYGINQEQKALFHSIQIWALKLTAKQTTVAAETAAHAAGNEAMTLSDELAASDSLIIRAGMAIKSILMDAKKAAAGAYSATVEIPYVGPFIAPGAAATALAATAAFAGGIVSAEGGYRVPSNVSEMGAILHPNEKVLPANEAHMNDEMYRMLKGGRQSQGNTYNTNVHVHGVQNMDQFRASKTQIQRAMKPRFS